MASDLSIVIHRSAFSLCYSPPLKNPLWVLEKLNGEKISRQVADRRDCRFKLDLCLRERFQARNADFTRSGYTRGHMAKASHHRYDQKALEESFYFTNISPQLAAFGGVIWLKLEKTLDEMIPEYEEVQILTGPVFKSVSKTRQVALRSIFRFDGGPVAIPEGFYKVFVGKKKEGNYELYSFLLPHQEIPFETSLKKFQVTLPAVEAAVGLELRKLLDLD